MTYSLDLRKAAVRMLSQGNTFRDVAQLVGVSTSTLHRWKTLGVSVARRQITAPKKLTTPVLTALRDFVQESPCTTLQRMRHHLKTSCSTTICRQTIAKGLRLLRISRKRTSQRLGAAASLPTPDVIDAFKRNATQALSTAPLVASLDECYFSERVLPLYGYSPVRQKCVVRSPVSSWVRRSLLLSVATDGTTQHVTHTGSINKARFQEFVSGLPYPSGTVVLLDNVAFHKDTTPMISKGYVPLFTPKYSPEYNPVENVLSKVKAAFRADWPWRCGVESAIDSAVASVDGSNIDGCFRKLRERVTEQEAVPRPDGRRRRHTPPTQF